MSNMDKEHKSPQKVFETGEIITAKVYKISPEQRAEYDRLSVEKLAKLREEAVPKIQERYEQLANLRRQKPEADEGGKPPGGHR